MQTNGSKQHIAFAGWPATQPCTIMPMLDHSMANVELPPKTA